MSLRGRTLAVRGPVGNSVLALPLLAALLAGCARDTFTPYVGQQREWPVAPGAFAASVNGVVVYHSPPAQPYRVLGLLVEENARDRWLAAAARAHGGDGVVILSSESEYAAQYNAAFGAAYGAQGVNLPLRRVRVTAVVIRSVTNAPALQPSGAGPGVPPPGGV